jgi:hypothetical protein
MRIDNALLLIVADENQPEGIDHEEVDEFEN